MVPIIAKVDGTMEKALSGAQCRVKAACVLARVRAFVCVCLCVCLCVCV